MSQDIWLMLLVFVAGAAAMLFLFLMVPSNSTFLSTLKGKRTYIIAAVGVAVFACEHFGVIPPGSAAKIDALLMPLGFGTLRLAISNVKEQA